MSDKSDDKHSLADKIKLLPEKPGVYSFYDQKDNILYVGKAKNLKKRVASYFNKIKSHSGKVGVMVKKIHHIETIVVEGELDALLLENNLIKKYQPRYNIMLKDDKSFPWICIKEEDFPRIFSTRNRINDGSEYYGPYASVVTMRTILNLIRQLYPLRTCKHKLSPANIRAGKFKLCLEYHIENCKGPCEGLETPEEYNERVSQIREIVKGNLASVSLVLKGLMMEYAEKQEFEKAQAVKERLQILEKYKAKSTIVNPAINDADVFSFIDGQKSVYCNYLKVIQGAVVQSHTIEMRRILDETPAYLLSHAVAEFRQRYESMAEEIIIPFIPEIKIPDIKYTTPKRGDKKMLLELSERNAGYYRLEKEKQRDLVDPERRTGRLMQSMKNDLSMQTEPKHIECFDNSNIQGSNAVAAMAVFIDGKPRKKEYRHYNIKSVTGPDDYASMEEVVYRRYKRMIAESISLPDLIIIDGGKGQLNSALSSLKKLGIEGKVKIIGIAKRLEQIYFPGDPIPLAIDKKSVTLKVIQHARDEAHRFGLNHHRKKRSKAMTNSVLSEIMGIGPVKSQKLLNKFKSVQNIKKAGVEELTAIVGKVSAERIRIFFE